MGKGGRARENRNLCVRRATACSSRGYVEGLREVLGQPEIQTQKVAALENFKVKQRREKRRWGASVFQQLEE